jgi:hypothetical protein
MGDGQNLQRETVVVHEISDRRIGIDHHLVGQATDAVFVERLELFEALTVGPVRVVGRHSRVHHVSKHVLVIADFELLGKGIEAETLDERHDPLVPPFEICDSIVGSHGDAFRLRLRGRDL